MLIIDIPVKNTCSSKKELVRRAIERHPKGYLFKSWEESFTSVGEFLVFWYNSDSDNVKGSTHITKKAVICSKAGPQKREHCNN